MNGIVAAFAATALYYLGFALFKIAADRMAPLRGNRILHMIWTILSSWVFLIALALVLGGLSLQILALAKLSLGVAVPIFMSGVLPLIVIAMVWFGDRLTAREWLSLALIGVAILLLAASIGHPPPIHAVDVPAWKLAVSLAPAVVVPLAVLVFEDHRPDGRHARPVTGIAYGLSSGFPVGTAELAIKGWADHGHLGLGILATAYPYITVLSAAIGFGIMVAAFQRCRVTIVAAVMTVSAKTYLLLMGTFLYGEQWPSGGLHGLLRLVALAVAVAAVLQFPRHRPLAQHEAYEPEAVAPAQDPFGGPAHRRPTSGLSPLDGGILAAPSQEPYPQPPQPPQQPPQRSPYAQDPLGQYRPPPHSRQQLPRQPIRGPQDPDERG
ncbi:DMT family transporter [Actinomadura parmotrematis]|uniref:DMT family transporter n=1 Tax=Actinomadura parmotrematis TaxID=2864039 RepID=A0ABS7FWN3_9ACTN|nr:DMT family transporter [Actinomadura parmotrematis]MBW8484089.1 DMT family transporter [Actinomadura parmotrematis]